MESSWRRFTYQMIIACRRFEDTSSRAGTDLRKPPETHSDRSDLGANKKPVVVPSWRRGSGSWDCREL